MLPSFVCLMELRSRTLTLLFLLLSARDASASASPHAPFPSPSPSPSPRTTPPKQLDSASTNIQMTVPPPPPPPPLSHRRARREHREHPAGETATPGPGSPKRLNLGEKVGLAFLFVTVALQVALGGFLVFKRLQLRKMVRVDQRAAVPSPT